MSFTYPPVFDELHSISDLHLGGVPGGQTFRQGSLLAATIDHLRRKSPDKRMLLVINGDTVDFLIEPNPAYLDPHGAVEKLERIMVDSAFAPFWQALIQFVQTPNRWLAVTLGNHDVELALPRVSERLLHALSGGDPEVRSRITLAFDGTGYTCLVGDKRVLCVHGNNVDIVNVVDHNALRRVVRDLNFGQEPKPWGPNGGTRMVIDILNAIKKDLPVLDFLKPESKAVAPVIVALDPSQLRKVKKLAPVLVSFGRDKVLRMAGFLSADEVLEAGQAAQPLSEEEAMDQLMGSAFTVEDPTTTNIDDLLAMADEGLNEDAVPAVVPGGDEETLGVGGLVWDIIRRRSPEKNLREALLAWLRDDNTFAIDEGDASFKQLDDEVAPDVNFILTGHTHLEKALRRKNGQGVYFNSGTWIRLIQLTEEMLAESRFGPIFKAFKAGTLAALDAVPGLVLERPTVVSIEQDAQGVYGELRHADQSGGQVTLQSVPNTRLRPGV